MIPQMREEFFQNFSNTTVPSKDYALETDKKHIGSSVEELEAVRQAIYFILNTERYEHLIYNWDYGVELSDLIGQPYSYVIPETERRIKEALMQDDRIKAVSDFKFERMKYKLHVTFSVTTIFGNVESEVEVYV